MAAHFVANLIRLKREGVTFDRDLILALTADEEGGTHNGVDWLIKNHRALIDAEFAINEGGGGNMRKGKYLTNEVQASEKVYQDFRLEVKNPGGHSSLPVKDNAISHLAAGLARLSALLPYYNALMRTTCVPTLLEGGHATNALPQLARANVNCRILPGAMPSAVKDTLIKVLA